MDLGLAGAAVCVQGGTKGMGRAASECCARDEIGPVIAFVGSRANSYMTGANINVDGGSDFC